MFADVDIHTGLLTVETIEEGYEEGVEAVLGTHVFGQPIDLSALKNFKHQSGCKLVFDAAPAFGTVFKSVDDFTEADATIISFHATKVFILLRAGLLSRQIKTYKIALI